MHSISSLTVVISLAAVTAVAAGAPSKGPPRSNTAPPLTVAAWQKDHPRMRALLQAGQDPNARFGVGLTPWAFSLIARDREGFRMLFDSVKDFRADDPIAAMIFLFQVADDDAELARTFLDRGVSADARANDGTSALSIAAANGHPDMVALLLARGARVDAADRHGDTPLMAAVRAGSVGCVRRLLAARAPVDQADKAGHRAMDYAVRSGRADVQRLLREAGAAAAPRPSSTPVPTAVAAAQRSLPLLARAATQWVQERSCNACHMQPVMLRVDAVARARGFTRGKDLLTSLDTSLRDEYGPHYARGAQESLKTDEGVAVASLHVGGDEAYALANSFSSLLDAGLPAPAYDRPTIELLARMQQPDGSWRHGPDRVPTQSGDITSTALAAKVLQAHAAENPAHAQRVARARRWLLAAVPTHTEDAAYRLMGLRWVDADAASIAAAVHTLKQRQLPGGGWAQVGGLNPDAYATGLSLVALHDGAGLDGGDPAYRRGVDYLRATQYPDGSWLVHKRAVPVNAYFESGFPHGKFQFTSFLGTAWATMALMYAGPESGSQARL